MADDRIDATLASVLEWLDLWVLERLAEPRGGYEPGEWAYRIDHIAGVSLTYDIARGVLRSLRDRGLATYCRGLFDDDGQPAGAGYAITAAGLARLAARAPGTTEAER